MKAEFKLFSSFSMLLNAFVMESLFVYLLLLSFVVDEVLFEVLLFVLASLYVGVC